MTIDQSYKDVCVHKMLIVTCTIKTIKTCIIITILTERDTGKWIVVIKL